MTDRAITRLLPDGAPDGGMQPIGYIDTDTVAEGIVDERGA